MRFSNGHASNISRLVNLEDCRLYGMKSHDCHMFLQTLISLAYHDLLSNAIRDALIEISHFFWDICSNKLQTHHIERLETNIIQIICKLEMIFSPSFFDSMEHLHIHLPYEVISTFISYYFELHLRTRINCVLRHDDGGEVPLSENL
jgi:hypothetical protein